MNRLHEK